jgi:hypothetical protein
VDVEVFYSFYPIFAIGHADPFCPGGFGANPHRFTIGLYRDATLIAERQLTLSSCYFRTRFTGLPASPGSYRATIKFERRVLPSLWSPVETMQTATLTASKAKAVPSFTVNGQLVVSDEPLPVRGTHPILIDGSSTRCATSYFFGVQESDRYWNRTFLYEWGSWFNGPPPASLNLQQLSTNHSYAPHYLGTDLSRQGAPLAGGYLDPPNDSQERFYRVGLCTAEPDWQCKTVLLEID